MAEGSHDLLKLPVLDLDQLSAAAKGRTPSGPMRLRAVPTGAGVGVPAADAPGVPEAQAGGRGDSGEAGGMAGHDGAGGIVDGRRSVQFTVPGAPVGKGRPIAGRSFGGHVTLRTPGKTVTYESAVRLFAAQAMAGAAPFAGPLKAAVHLELPIPASWSKKKQAQALAGQLRPTTKPDMDNVIKALFDAMNGVVYGDDVQVVLLTAAKVYGASPCAQVFIQKLDPSIRSNP